MKILVFILCCVFLVSCKNQNVSDSIPLVKADRLFAAPDSFIGKKIQLEGKIVHVCPVNGLKMKLLCNNKMTVKIVSSDSAGTFPHTWNGKQIRVEGIIHETKVSRQELDSMAAARMLLCHIDESPCLDSIYVIRMEQKGLRDSSVRRTRARLEQIMVKNNTDYISVITLVANKVEEIEMQEETVKTAQNKKDSGCQGCPLCSFCFPQKS